MYSWNDTTISTAVLGMFFISLLLGASVVTGSVGAAGATTQNSIGGNSGPAEPAQTQGLQEWCVSFGNTGVSAELPTDTTCSAVKDISQHQQINLNYEIQKTGSTQFFTLDLENKATDNAKVNISVTGPNGVQMVDASAANDSLAFVQERHYNRLTTDYENLTVNADGEIVTTTDASNPIPLTDRRTLQNTYTDSELETILSANLTQDELMNLRASEMKLTTNGNDKMVLAHDFTCADFGLGSDCTETSITKEFEYSVELEFKSRGRQVAATQFSVTRNLKSAMLQEPAAGEGPGSDIGSTSSSVNSTQVIQSGFDVVLDEPVVTDISRYADGTDQISALQDPSIPPNAGGSNSALGTAKNVSYLRTNSTKFPAAIYGDSQNDAIRFGSAYYGIPQANNHYLVLTYAFQGESENSNIELSMVDRQGNIIDKQKDIRYLPQTSKDSIDLSDREQYTKAIEEGTLNTKKVAIELSPKEVRYINDNYAAFFKYATDGGEDVMLLFESEIVSQDVQLNTSNELVKDPDGDVNYEENPATFDISYRMPYNLNAEYNQVDILPGETMRIPVTIKNAGDLRVERTVGVYDEYQENHQKFKNLVTERTVMVEPQSQKTVFLEYSWPAHQHGNHTLTVYDTTNGTQEDWDAIESREGTTEYSAYILQPPTFEVIGMSAPDSWLVYDHFQTLVAVQNVGDLNTDFLPPGERPYIQGEFGPWQGKITDYVGGGDVRAGEAGGTVNMYFNRTIKYTPDYPNLDETYSDSEWRENAPYHTSVSNKTDAGERIPYDLTVEAVHPWAVINGENPVTGTPNVDQITYNQMEAPQLDADNEIVMQDADPSDDPFIDYTTDSNPDRFIYQNELRNCHLAGNHTNYTDSASLGSWNETQVVNNCGGMMQRGVDIYELGVSTVRLRNTTDEMVERIGITTNRGMKTYTPGDNVYYPSAWPYTETDPSVDTATNLEDADFSGTSHYDVTGWNVNSFGLKAHLTVDDINTYLTQYENGELTRDQLRKELLTATAYTNGQNAFTDKGLERATSCSNSSTSQTQDGTPPGCEGFGLESKPMPTTLIENIQSPIETTNEHDLYLDAHIVNEGGASAGTARIKIVTNKSNAGIGGSNVVGYASAEIQPNTDRIIRVPVVIPNKPAAQGEHDLQVKIRTEPDYSSYSIGGFERRADSWRFGVTANFETWSDFNFENLTVEHGMDGIDQRCNGIGVGECTDTTDQTIFTQWNYTNHGGTEGTHEINASYGFWKTPTGEGSDWPTLHHKQKTQQYDSRVITDKYWLSSTPNDMNWVAEGSTLQKSATQTYGAGETESWVLQNRVKEPGIYRLYVTQERVNGESDTTLDRFNNTTYSMWGYAPDNTRASESTYLNDSHWEQFQVYDIKDPVSRFHYITDDFPQSHSATGYTDSTNGDVEIWEGGTAHFDGDERTDWTLAEYENGIAQELNVSSDNVGVDTYSWSATSGAERLYMQAHDNAGSSVEGKNSWRFNETGTHQVSLTVTDYPAYTEGDGNPNSNTSTQNIVVKDDTEDPYISISQDSLTQHHDVYNNNVIWTGTPDGESQEFTTVDWSVFTYDNQIGVECGGTLDDGTTVDHCGWEKDSGVWLSHDDGSVVDTGTFDAVQQYQTRTNANYCVRFYAQDFAANENQDEYCVTVYEDTTDPTASYTSDQTWVWADYHNNGYTGGSVTYDASASSDNGDPKVGLHDRAFDHTLSGSWQSGATESTTYDADASSPSRTETEKVTVRDWYGNSDQTSASVTVRTDTTPPNINDNTKTPDYDPADGCSVDSNSDDSCSDTSWSDTKSTTVCGTDRYDSGYDGGVGIYSGDSDPCYTFSYTLSINTDPAAPSPSPNPSPDAPTASASCGGYADAVGPGGDYDYTSTDNTSDTDKDCDTDCNTDTGSDDWSGSHGVDVEDWHGNTDSATVYVDASASFTGERCETDCETETDTDSDTAYCKYKDDDKYT